MYALKQRVHPTWMLTVLCVGVVVGIALAQVIVLPVAGVLLGGITAIIVSFWRRHAWMLALVFVGGCLVGLWRGGQDAAQLQALPHFDKGTVHVIGVVATDPTASRNGIALQLRTIKINNHDIPGEWYVTTDSSASLRRDDIVALSGAVVVRDTGVAMYDANILQITRPHNIFLDVRDTMGAALRRALAEPMASLGIGFLLGQKSDLPGDFSAALKVVGLTHIVVASGYNLTILVRLARRLFEKISKYQAALWSILLMLGFMAIAGWSASMTRAGLVTALSLWAWYYGRKFHPVTLLVLAAAITAWVRPAYAWGDIGWLLSFAAFAGVLILAPLLQAYFFGTDKKPGFIGQVLIETTAAQLMTIPITLSVFGQFSVVALISNVLILPLVPYAMLLTLIAGLGGIAAWPAGVLLQYTVGVVNWTAGFPWAQITWQLPWWGVLLSYAGLAGICIYVQRVTRYQLRRASVVE